MVTGRPRQSCRYVLEIARLARTPLRLAPASSIVQDHSQGMVKLLARVLALLAAILTVGWPGASRGAAGKDWLVGTDARGGTGIPTIQAALQEAAPGDTIQVAPGRYAESLTTVRGGAPGQPIRLVASGGRGTVQIVRRGRVLTVNHPHIVVEGFVFDGGYGADDTVRVGAAANDFVLRDCEVRRSSRDLIDLAGAPDTLIERCLLHHALNAAGGRTDAHAIAAGPVRGLTIRDSEIHTFSGDGLQVDPSRAAQGWTNVLVERVNFWLAPLPRAENGFAAGTVPGENAVDTKTSGSGARATLRLREVAARGFENGLITNIAAFNLKERVDVTAERVTVSQSNIAFRVRGAAGPGGGARLTLTNAVFDAVAVAVRYEDGVQDLRIRHTTFGSGVRQAFRSAGGASPAPDVRNSLFLGRRPPGVPQATNLEVDEAAFTNVRGHDYRLAPLSLAIDRGVAISDIYEDMDGLRRPIGVAPDVGAYERQTIGAPDASVPTAR